VTPATREPKAVNSMNEMRLPSFLGEPGDRDVGRGADQRAVAAEAGAERQRPPQDLAVGPALSCASRLATSGMVTAV
jgi:hypothetical protein